MRMLGFALVGFLAPMLLFLAVALALDVPWQVFALSAVAVAGAAALALAVWWLGDRRPDR
jgi:heme/copper-type cytochrome/quinol oxidase subunit 4